MEDRYLPSANAGTRRGTAHAGRPQNSSNEAGMPNVTNSGNAMTTANISYRPTPPNAGAMPKHNNVMRPEIMTNPNIGLMPERAPKPNMGLMPEMTPKPNMGLMPDMTPNSNMGVMPYMTPKPMENDMSECGYKNGELPPCAPLSVGFVPFQEKNPPKYGSEEALTRGTLFPGLDLPWKNVTNKTNPYAGTPMGEMMALGFVIKELNLYLDTHMNDKEALDMLKSLNKLMQEGRERFIKLYGPQTISDITSGDEYTWIDNPWPWEYTERGGADNHV